MSVYIDTLLFESGGQIDCVKTTIKNLITK